jgi:hypothetical protein
MNANLLPEQPLEEIEALVRLAGDYVQPSDDLRPRILEAARVVKNERQARRQIVRLAAMLLFAVVSLAMIGRPRADERSRFAADLWSLESSAPANGTRAQAGWEMVDSFTALRREQARLLHLEL